MRWAGGERSHLFDKSETKQIKIKYTHIFVSVNLQQELQRLATENYSVYKTVWKKTINKNNKNNIKT